MISKVFSALVIPWFHDSTVVPETGEVSLRALAQLRITQSTEESMCEILFTVHCPVDLITVKYRLYARNYRPRDLPDCFSWGFFLFVSLGGLCVYCSFVFLRNLVLCKKS